MLHVTDKWLKATDESKYTGAVFLDLAKGFETADYVILLFKLECIIAFGKRVMIFCVITFLTGNNEF